jgi:hypothetical protein
MIIIRSYLPDFVEKRTYIGEIQSQCEKFEFEFTRLVGLPDWNIL